MSIISILRLYPCSKILARRILLDQRFWRDQLISGGLSSFLWCVDAKQCLLKDQEGKPDLKQLSQTIAAENFITNAIAHSLQGREEFCTSDCER